MTQGDFLKAIQHKEPYYIMLSPSCFKLKCISLLNALNGQNKQLATLCQISKFS